jgi:2-methylcitrate dehydratase
MNTALFDLIEQHRIDPARVKKLRIGLSRPAFDLHGGLARYKGKFEALISAHYTAAVILYDRALTLAQFEPSRYEDPLLQRASAEQVEIAADPTLTGVQATAEVEMADGSKLSARCEHPRGSPENPLSRAQIVDKLRTYAPDRISAAAIDEVVRSVDRLEDVPSVSWLMEILRAESIVDRPVKRAVASGRG